jgi:hypothetical protein
MKNRVLKTCLTALAFSVAGLANANTGPIDLLTYSVISGGAVNIAAQPDYVTAPNVGGHLAGQAAVTIGAFTTVNDIYAGAAVTTGASSRVKQIHAGAAAGVGANAYAQDVDAGAAVVVGAGGAVGDIIAGAAITLGAGSTYYSTSIDAVVTEGAGSMVVSPENGGYTDDGVIVIAADMNAAMEAINAKFVDNPVDVNEVETYTDLSGLTIGDGGAETTVYYSAINLQANTTLTIEGNVTVITSESMTMGAGAEVVLEDGATVTWMLGGSLNLGAGSKFSGETYVNGAVNGATSDVECGNLYATGAVSVGSIGEACMGPKIGVTVDISGELVCPLWGGQSGWNEWVEFAGNPSIRVAEDDRTGYMQVNMYNDAEGIHRHVGHIYGEHWNTGTPYDRYTSAEYDISGVIVNYSLQIFANQVSIDVNDDGVNILNLYTRATGWSGGTRIGRSYVSVAIACTTDLNTLISDYR